MVLELSVATEEDLRSIAAVSYAAYHTNDIHNMSTHFFPSHTPEQIQAWHLEKLAPSFQDKTIRCAKITDSENGRIVSYTRWGMPRTSPENSYHRSETPMPEGANKPLIDAFETAMDEKRKLYMDEKKDYSR